MKRMASFFASLFVLVFFIVLIMYTSLGVLHIDNVAGNFGIGITFQIIGFLLLIGLTVMAFFVTKFKVGYLIPLFAVTILYVILLNILNMFAIFVIATPVFMLLNMVLLFIYCVVSIPMFIMGFR